MSIFKICAREMFLYKHSERITLPVPIPDEDKKLT